MVHKIVITICLSMLVTVKPSIMQVNYRYAYIVVTQSNVAQIHTVNLTTQAFTITQNLAIPDQWLAPSFALVNPNGEWLVSLLPSAISSSEGLLVRLFNITSGETRDIAQGFFAGREAGFVGTLQNLAWSPDGRFLALNMTLSQEPSDLEIFVYSVSDNSLINLTDDEYSQMHIAWASDSAHLVTLTEDCSFSDDTPSCIRTLDTLDVIRQIHQESLDLLDLGFGPAVTGAIACDLGWSPDSQFVSFVSGCDDFVTDVTKEVHLWNLNQKDVTQITDFTTTLKQDGATFLRGRYKLAWFNSENLLIGASYQSMVDVVNTQSVLYNLTDNRTATISSKMGEEWELNPVTNQIAIRNIGIEIVNGEEYISGNVELLAPEAVSSDLNTSYTHNTSLNLSLGCHLAWSPDGATLAYVTTTSGDCADPIQSIIFVDGATGAVQEYIPELDGDVWYTLPIGWIQG